MNTVSDDIQDTIYKYKHQIEFKSVVNELNEIVDYWCDEHLTYRYCKGRHEKIYNHCRTTFQCLKDYEEHLSVELTPNNILGIINDDYDIANQ